MKDPYRSSVTNDRYGSPAANEAAIATAAKKAHSADPSLTVSERIRLESFHRFLSRIFAEQDDSNWVLKGGTGMLAWVASARSTTDIDLFRRGQTLDAALEDQGLGKVVGHVAGSSSLRTRSGRWA